MIYLDRPVGVIEGLQIFRDHADGNQFYYVPERPRLAMNGDEPEFIFLKYARDITDNPDFKENDAIGGGLLAFTVDLGVDDATMTRVRGRLLRYADGGPVALSPIFFENGTVRLSMIADKTDDEAAAADAERRGIKIFEEAWGTSVPSLFGSNRATFGVSLGHEAAQLMEASLKAGIGYIGVIYDLEFLGMRPAFNVKVTADYSRIYNHFEGELGGQANVYGVMLQAELGFGYQKLIDEGAIKIEVITFTDKEDLVAQAEAAKEWALGKITEDLFKSSLQPPSFMTRGSSSPLDALARLAGALASNLGGRDPRDTIASRPQSSTAAHLDGQVQQRTRQQMPAPEAVAERDHVAHPPEESQDAAAPAADDATGSEAEGQAPVVERPAVDQPTDAGGGSLTGGAGDNYYPYKVGLSLRFYRQEELKKRVFEFSRQAAERRRLAPQGLFSTIIQGRRLDDRILSVNLDSDFFKRINLEVRPATDWEHEGIELSTVAIEYPGELAVGEQPTHADGFAFSHADQTPRRFMTFLNDDKDMSYRYKTEVHFKANSPWVGRDQVLRGGWIQTRVRPLTINALDHVGLLDIEISSDNTLFQDGIDQAIVEVAYRDAGNDWTAAERFVVDPEHASHAWKLRLLDRRITGYRYTVEYFLEGNVRFKTPPRDEREPKLVISSPFRNKKRIRLVPARDTEGIVEAIVDVTYQEPEHGYRREIQQVFTPDALMSKAIEFDTLAAVPLPYTYRTTIVGSDGSVFESDEISSEASVILVTAGAGEAQRVTARLVADSTSLAPYYAVELQVREDSGDVESEVFVASDAQDGAEGLKRTLWIAREADQPLHYEWRWIGYRRDGTTRETDQWTEEADDELVFHLN